MKKKIYCPDCNNEVEWNSIIKEWWCTFCRNFKSYKPKGNGNGQE